MRPAARVTFVMSMKFYCTSVDRILLVQIEKKSRSILVASACGNLMGT